MTGYYIGTAPHNKEVIYRIEETIMGPDYDIDRTYYKITVTRGNKHSRTGSSSIINSSEVHWYIDDGVIKKTELTEAEKILYG